MLIEMLAVVVFSTASLHATAMPAVQEPAVQGTEKKPKATKQPKDDQKPKDPQKPKKKKKAKSDQPSPDEPIDLDAVRGHRTLGGQHGLQPHLLRFRRDLKLVHDVAHHGDQIEACFLQHHLARLGL